MITIPEDQTEPACPKNPNTAVSTGRFSSIKFAFLYMVNSKLGIGRNETLIILGYMMIGVIDAMVSYTLSYIRRSGELDIGPFLGLIVSPLWPMNLFMDFIYLVNYLFGTASYDLLTSITLMIGNIITLGLVFVGLFIYFKICKS